MSDNNKFSEIQSHLVLTYGYKPWLIGSSKNRTDPSVGVKERAQQQLEYITKSMDAMTDGDKIGAIAVAISSGAIEDSVRNTLWDSIKKDPTKVTYVLDAFDDYYYGTLLDHGFKGKEVVVDYLIEHKNMEVFLKFCAYHGDGCPGNIHGKELEKPYLKKMVMYMWNNYTRMHKTYFKDEEVFSPDEFKHVRDFMQTVVPLEQWLATNPSLAKLTKTITQHAYSYRIDMYKDPVEYQTKMDSLVETLSKNEKTKWVSQNMTAIVVFGLDMGTDAYWKALLTSPTSHTKPVPSGMTIEF